ncbi:hypothetical protein ASZ78_003819 [Callipepla squamata]|uniref:DNA-dependent protein kinase catalytic subunit n=1 Tax=Callipepla squamata TaxID=9009 RepID=A0A226MK71_CALSU|nr:hypothetical protein ASZ78_003819 [Callipepla squamata]
MAGGVQEWLEALHGCLQPSDAVRGYGLLRGLGEACLTCSAGGALALHVSLVFGPERGLLAFVCRSLGLEEVGRHPAAPPGRAGPGAVAANKLLPFQFRDCREEALKFLCVFLEKIGERVHPYARSLKQTCISVYTKEKAAKCKIPALELLIKLLQSLRRSCLMEEMKVGEIFNKFYGELAVRSKVSDTVLEKIYELLGVLGEVHPTDMINNSEKLFRAYLGELKTQVHLEFLFRLFHCFFMTSATRLPKLTVVAGCLRGLTALMYNFTKSVDEDAQTSKEIFDFAVKAIRPQVDQKRYAVHLGRVQATYEQNYTLCHLPLFSEYKTMFGTLLLDSYVMLFETMCKWCGHTNQELKKAGHNALDSFLKQMSSMVAKDAELHKSKLKFFMEQFYGIIRRMDSSNKELSIAIRGYGLFAAPCKAVHPKDVDAMYVELLQRCKQMYLTEAETMDDHLYQLPSFLQSIASVIFHLDTIPEVYTPVLEHLVVLQINSFPQYSEKMQLVCCRSIIKVFLALSIKGPVLWSFIGTVVHQGLIRVFSKPVTFSKIGYDFFGRESSGSEDFPESGEVETAKWKVPTYKDYLYLFRSLLSCDTMKESVFEEENFLTGNSPLQSLSRLLYDELIKSILKIIEKLDLTVQKLNVHEQDENETDSAFIGPTSDPASNLQPKKPTDFIAFINLVEFCRDILPDKHVEYFKPWVYSFGYELIIHSTRLPLISGFYKLLSVTMKIAKKIKYFEGVSPKSLRKSTEDPEKSSCFALFAKFGKEVTAKMKQYKDELLASCLNFLLSLPHDIIMLDIKAYIPALQNAFKLGLSCTPMADLGLDALEDWSAHIPRHIMQPYYKDVLPLLDGYLKNSTTKVEPQDNWEVRKLSRAAQKGFNKIVIQRLRKAKSSSLDDNPSLEAVRTRVAHLLGSLGGQINHNLITATSAEEMMKKCVSWDTESHLSFAVPFADMKPVIYLDAFLPRVTDLALSASDRQSKVAACELLHSIVAYMLGKASQMPERCQGPPPMYQLYKRIFPVLLRLACDVDQVTRQLYEPLVMQLIHWFTNNKKFESQDTVTFLEAILSGIVDPVDSTLRDFCGQCVREFLKWSIKQTTPRQQEKSPANTKSLFKRLYSLALHPSAFKRLGAALAFNSIYREFREENSLVEQFVFEALVVFLESLALTHTDEKSLDVFSFLSGNNSPSSWLADVLKKRDISFLINKFEGGGSDAKSPSGILSQPTLRDMQEPFSLQTVMRWMDMFLAALDCYNTFFELRMIKPHEILGVNERSSFLEAVDFFLETIALHDIHAAEQCFDCRSRGNVFSPQEREMYNYSKCTIIVRIMEFVTMILETCQQDFWKLLEKELLNANFVELVVMTVCDPSHIGFNTADVQVMKNLPDISVRLLKALMKSPYKGYLQLCLKKRITPQSFEDLCFVDLFNSDARFDQVRFSAVLSACKQLQKSGLLQSVLHNQDEGLHPSVGSKLLSVVYKSIAPGSERHSLPSVDINSKRVADRLLQLAFAIDDQCEELVSLLLNTVVLSVPLSESSERNFVNFTHGQYFYSLFSDTINQQLLKNLDAVIIQLMESSVSNPQMVGSILNGMLDQSFRERTIRKQQGVKLVTAVLRNWKRLDSWWAKGSSPESKVAVLTLLAKVLQIDSSVSFNTSHEAFTAVFDTYTSLLTDQNLGLNLKGQAVIILPFFTNLTGEKLNDLKNALDQLVAFNFPMSSDEFPKGTLKHNNYVDCTKKVETDKVSDDFCIKPSEMHKQVYYLLQSKKLRASVESSRLILHVLSNTDKQVVLLDTVHKMFQNEDLLSNTVRQAFVDRSLLTLMSHCNLDALREFFCKIIVQAMDTLNSRFTKSNECVFDTQVTKKMGYYKLLEVMYIRLSKEDVHSKDSKINQAYRGSVSVEGNELTKALMKSCYDAFTENMAGESQLLEKRRQYHCAAYNCAIAVISCVFTESKFYQGFLFTEKSEKNLLIFENLIDLKRQYTFPVEIEVPLERKKRYIAIRKEAREAWSGGQDEPKYLASASYMMDSSLSEEMSQFDFSTGVQGFSYSSQDATASSAHFRRKVECIVKSVNTDNIRGTVPIDLPLWMKFLHSKLGNPSVPLNIRLFIAKLIVNTEDVFRPYAKQWLGPMLQLVVSGNNGGEGIHYMVVEIAVTVLSWTSVATPKGNIKDEILANRLLEFLMKNAFHQKRAVFRHNLEIIKTVIECWKNCLSIPYSLIFDKFSSGDPDTKDNSVGIQLLGIVLANNLPPFDLKCEIDRVRYFQALISNMGLLRYKEVYAAAAEVLGLALQYIAERQNILEDPVYDCVIKQLKHHQNTQQDKFIICLNKIVKNFPPLADRFMNAVFFLIPKLHGVMKNYCLEVIMCRAEEIPDLYLQLKSKDFIQIMKHRDDERQRVCLDIVYKMLSALKPPELKELLPGVTGFISHPSVVCRQRMYDILMWIYDNYSDPESQTDDDSQEVLGLVKEVLLQGLIDENAELQLIVRNFWSDETRLPANILDRMLMLLSSLYSAKIETQYLSLITNFLLEMTSKSPDYSRKIFEHPLSECKFQDFVIDSSWRYRSTMLTPMFVETQASQSTNRNLSQERSLSISGSVGGQVRATQRQYEFTPTQNISGRSSFNWLTGNSIDTLAEYTVPSSESLSSSMLLVNKRSEKFKQAAFKPVGPDFGKKKLGLPGDKVDSKTKGIDERAEILRLRRRFLKDQEKVSLIYARKGVAEQKREKEMKSELKMKFDGQVTLYRSYRVGDLPDIQIEHCSLIAPLQGLAQRDPTFAKQLFSSLFGGIFHEVEKSKIPSEKKVIIQKLLKNFNHFLSTSLSYFPPFIACIQFTFALIYLCSTDENISLFPLGRLYRSLGDYDVLRGIFSGKIGTKDITQQALLAEARSDYAEAAKCYDEALSKEDWQDGEPTEAEKDFWELASLECYDHLTEWKSLEYCATVNIDSGKPPDLSKTWSDPFYQEMYLPYIIRSKLKLLLNGENDQTLLTFIDEAMKAEQKKALIEMHYSQELSLLYILQDDFDRAKYYIGNGMQIFMQEISYKHRDLLELDSASVSTSCLASLQQPVGILLLERALMALSPVEEPPLKRMRGRTELPPDVIKWIELAKLYRSLGDYDVLRGIFSGKIGTKDITQQALLAEARSDYAEAAKCYDEALSKEDWQDGEPTEAEKDFWELASLECYDHLTEWKSLEYCATVNIDSGKPPDLSKTWSDPFYQEMYLPYIIRSKLKLLLNGENDQTLLTFIDEAMKTEQKKALIEMHYSQELSLLYILQDDFDRAKYYIGNGMQIFMQFCCIPAYFCVEGNLASRAKSLKRLLRTWTSRYPDAKMDPMNIWDDIITNRCFFLDKLQEKFLCDQANDSMEVDEENGVGDQMEVDQQDEDIHSMIRSCKFNMKLKMIESARKQNSFSVAKKLLKDLRREARTREDWLVRWNCAYCRFVHSCSQSQSCPERVLSVLKTISLLEDTKSDYLDKNIMAFRNQNLLLGTTYHIMANALSQDPRCFEQIGEEKAGKIQELSGERSGTPEKVLAGLNKRAFQCFSSAARKSEEEVQSHTMEHVDVKGVIDAYMTLAGFCDQHLRKEEEGSLEINSEDLQLFPAIVVEKMIKALKLNSREARLRFPRLLQIVERYPAETLGLVTRELPSVPCWQFIGWISQMMALLDKDEAVAVQHTVEEIADTYPQAIIYPFMISSESYCFKDTARGCKNKEFVASIKNKLDRGGVVQDFIHSLEQLSNPVMLFKDWVEDVRNELGKAQRNKIKLKEMYEEMYKNLGDVKAPGLGWLRKRFAQAFGKDFDSHFGKGGSKLLDMKVVDFDEITMSLRTKMNKSHKEPGNLKECSPWMSEFKAEFLRNELEVPGQYDGKGKPLPEYHVKISGFDERIMVLESLRKPKRIMIRGSDEQEYPFLVKGGEDLRQDQRIEQLFDVMNIILSRDAACSQRNMQLKTYQVIPMTTRLGLIKWLENTCTLKEFLRNSMTEEEDTNYNSRKGPRSAYTDWLSRMGGKAQGLARYTAMYKNASRTETVIAFKSREHSVPEDLLRRAFVKMSTSPEAFLALRSHFASSHALMCISHWILGIGDRHLSNFMINKETGGMVGIDFGHAFGSATQFLPVPELMPFRLTRQFVNLMMPVKEWGLIYSVMVHALRAYRADPDLLINTMDVFVKEPSLDWKNFEQRQLKKGGTWIKEINTAEVNWYPLQKVSNVKRKLTGTNPARITCDELRLAYEKSPCYNDFAAVARGSADHNVRAREPEDGLSEETQVRCLIDQATDPNVLGRVWEGWEPWM